MSVKEYIIISILIFPLFASANDNKPEPLFIVHFETGTNWNKSLAPSEQPKFKEHSANLNHLRTDGVIKFGARYSEFGVIILKSKSLETATALLKEDPGVQAGIFIFKIKRLNVFYPWKK